MIPLTHTAFLRVVDASALLSRAMRLECASMATFDTVAVPTRGGTVAGQRDGLRWDPCLQVNAVYSHSTEAAQRGRLSRESLGCTGAVLSLAPLSSQRTQAWAGRRRPLPTARASLSHERVRAAARHRFFKCYSLRS